MGVWEKASEWGPVHGQNRDDLAVFFVLCFLALGGHCLQMLCLPEFGTCANTQNLPHCRAFPASIQEQSPPKCLFFMANAKLPNRPGFALLPNGGLGPGAADSRLFGCSFGLSLKILRGVDSTSCHISKTRLHKAVLHWGAKLTCSPISPLACVPEKEQKRSKVRGPNWGQSLAFHPKMAVNGR